MQHFAPWEFECSCGQCDMGFEDMQPDLLDRLADARAAAEIPFSLTSAVRCPEWNEKVGGVDSSAHVSGYAVDISAPRLAQRFTILEALIYAGFDRIGVADSFIHADCDPSKTPGVVWLY